MDAPDDYQTTYDSTTKIVVFYSLNQQWHIWSIEIYCYNHSIKTRCLILKNKLHLYPCIFFNPLVGQTQYTSKLNTDFMLCCILTLCQYSGCSYTKLPQTLWLNGTAWFKKHLTQLWWFIFGNEYMKQKIDLLYLTR